MSSGAWSASTRTADRSPCATGGYGAYVNWGKVNATISKGTPPDSITLSDALELIAEREGKPAARPRKPAKKAPARGKARPAKAVAAEAQRQDANRRRRKKRRPRNAADQTEIRAAGKRG